MCIFCYVDDSLRNDFPPFALIVLKCLRFRLILEEERTKIVRDENKNILVPEKNPLEMANERRVNRINCVYISVRTNEDIFV